MMDWLRQWPRQRLALALVLFGIAFGIGQQSASASLLHSDCWQQCEIDCGPGGCAQASGGCVCVWTCVGGGGGRSVCA